MKWQAFWRKGPCHLFFLVSNVVLEGFRVQATMSTAELDSRRLWCVHQPLSPSPPTPAPHWTTFSVFEESQAPCKKPGCELWAQAGWKAAMLPQLISVPAIFLAQLYCAHWGLLCLLISLIWGHLTCWEGLPLYDELIHESEPAQCIFPVQTYQLQSPATLVASFSGLSQGSYKQGNCPLAPLTSVR